MLVVVMLLMVVTSLNLPISGSDMQHFGSALSKTRSIPQPLVTVIMENVTIFENRSCQLELLMTLHNSSLSQLFRDFLGFTRDISEAESLPEIVNFNDTVTIGPDVEEYIAHSTRAQDNSSSVPVKDVLLNGIIQEHWYSLGITIMPEDIIENKTWGIDGECIVKVTAKGSVQEDGSGEVPVGPLNLNGSFTRAGFILTKIGQIQQMLGSFDDEQIYDSLWGINFVLPGNLANEEELDGKSWYQDFGNGTLLEANLAVTGPEEVFLTETMQVTENAITVTPEELLEDRFLCYKVFHIEYETGGGQSTSNPLTYSESKDMNGIDSAFDPSWSVDLLDEEFSLPIIDGTLVDVTLNVHPQLTLSGHVSWDFKRTKQKYR